MSEEKLQSEIVRKFSELFPDKRGQLFHVPNQRAHKLQAFIARAIGIFPGVSDLIYFEDDLKLGLEIKAPDSRHKVQHVEQQVKWGEILESKKGIWRIVRSVDDAISLIEGDYTKGLTISDVREMIRLNGGKKTIKF